MRSSTPRTLADAVGTRSCRTTRASRCCAGGSAMVYSQINAPDRTRSAADGIHRDSAELPGAGVGVRRTAGRGPADGGRRARDRRLDVGAARCITFSTDVSIFALNLTHRDGSGAGHRLHAADHQSLPRRTRRRRRPRSGPDPHHGHRGPHRAVLGDDGRAVDGGHGDVPDVLPAGRSPMPGSRRWRSRRWPRSS